MTQTLKVEIVTPEGVVYAEDALMITLPAIEGQIGVLPEHIPLMTRIVPGEMVVNTPRGITYLAVGGGLVHITRERVWFVTDMAVAADRIDEAKAEEARRRALARLSEKISDEEVASVNASLARSLAQLTVKRRRRV